MGYTVSVSVNVLMSCPGSLGHSPASPEKVRGVVLALRGNCIPFSSIHNLAAIFSTETMATGIVNAGTVNALL